MIKEALFLAMALFLINFVYADPSITYLNNTPEESQVKFYTSDNPNLKVIYPSKWVADTKIVILISFYDDYGNKYLPRNIIFTNISDDLSLISILQNNNTEIESTFYVSGNADLGKNSLNLIIDDSEMITRQINYEIINESELLKVKSDIKWIYWIIGIFVFVFILFMIALCVIIDKNRGKYG